MKNLLALVICAGVILVLWTGFTSAPAVVISLVCGFAAGAFGRRRTGE